MTNKIVIKKVRNKEIWRTNIGMLIVYNRIRKRYQICKHKGVYWKFTDTLEEAKEIIRAAYVPQ